MTDDDELAALQFEINQVLYADILRYYSAVLNQTDYTTAMGMIISALSTNLAAILSQIPDTQREKYISISKEIFDKSMLILIKNMDINRWGNIGNA